MLLAVNADHERWDVNNLFANTNVAVTDEHSRMVDGLGKAKLEDLCLQTTLQEVLPGKGQSVDKFFLKGDRVAIMYTGGSRSLL